MQCCVTNTYVVKKTHQQPAHPEKRRLHQLHQQFGRGSLFPLQLTTVSKIYYLTIQVSMHFKNRLIKLFLTL